MRRLLLPALLLAAPALAETRCGWIVNPSPANWWLLDADGAWALMAQGGPGVPGLDLMPDLTGGEWVETNGSYGHGCACAELDTAGAEVLALRAFRQLPLAACEADPALPAPRPQARATR